MHFKHYENPYSRLAQYVNCAAANPGADAGMYDASEQYKLSTRTLLLPWMWLTHLLYRDINFVFFAIIKIRTGSEIYTV